MIKYQLEGSSKRGFSGISVKRTVVVNNEPQDEALIYFRGANKVFCGSTDDDLFEFMNLFLTTLSPAEEARHWEYLVEAKRIIEPGYFDEPETAEIERLRANNLDYKFLCNELYTIFVKMYENIPADSIVYAAEAVGALKPPADLNDITRQGDYPEETTINEEKYKKIAGLAFVTRLALPVYNQLADHIGQITGKEYVYSVVGDAICRLPCIRNHPGYDILSTYVTSSLRKKDSNSVQVNVVSAVKLTNNLINKGILNKLALTYIPSKLGGKNLSNELNSLVQSQTRQDSSIKIKTLKSESGDLGSLQESYKIAQEINASDELALGEYFTFDLIYETAPGVYAKKDEGFFKHQCQGLGIKDQWLAERVYNTIPNNRVFHLTNSHIKLLQLVYQEDIPYNLYLTLDFNQLMCALSLAQVKLFEMGFEQLAIFMMCVKNIVDSIPHLDDATKLNSMERKYLTDICDHYEMVKGTPTNNSAVQSVTAFLEEVIQAEWRSNIEEGLLGNRKFAEAMASNHDYEVSFDVRIKHELLELIKLRNN